MIRRLAQDDHEEVLRFLLPEREVNLFILGDIENFGYDFPEIPIWGDFDPEGRLRAVLLRFYDSLVFYSRGEDDRDAMLDLIRQQSFRLLSGSLDIVRPVGEALGLTLDKDLYFCRMEKPVLEGLAGPIDRVDEAGPDDIPQIIDLLNQIEEFLDISRPEPLRQKFKTREGRVFVVRENGRIVSIAQSTAECRFAGMVVGVATLPGFRQRGFASACMARLCQALAAEGKGACLFYDNPKAGSIYKRIGFEDIGRWAMFSRKDTQS